MSFERVIFEQRKRNIRELVDAPIPLERTPAADLIAFQVERNIEQAQRERPTAPLQVHALMTAERLLDVPMYNRLSGQPFFGPKPYERVDTFDAMKVRRHEVVSGIAHAHRVLQADPTNTIDHKNAWMALTRNDIGATAYRIYLSPDVGAVGDIFLDIAESVPRDLGFQMKTFDDRAGYAEIARVDKIIVYGSEEEIDRLFATVRYVYVRHANAFHERMFPPGGLPTEMPGVSVARQSQVAHGSEKKTGTQVLAEAMDTRMRDRGTTVAKQYFLQFRHKLHEVTRADEGRFLHGAMARMAAGVKWHAEKKWPSEAEQLPEDVRKGVSGAYARAMFRQTARALALGDRVSLKECKGTMMEELQSVPLTSAQRYAFQSAPTIGDMVMFGADEKDLVKTSIQMTGIALALHSGLRTGESAGDAFRHLLIG